MMQKIEIEMGLPTIPTIDYAKHLFDGIGSQHIKPVEDSLFDQFDEE
jgi:hypothetical protein